MLNKKLEIPLDKVLYYLLIFICLISVIGTLPTLGWFIRKFYVRYKKKELVKPPEKSNVSENKEVGYIEI